MKLNTLTRALAIARPASPAAEHPVVAQDRPARPVPAEPGRSPIAPPRLSLVHAATPAIRQVRPSLRGLSFAALVVMPIAVAAAYFFAIAADQYVAEFRFTLNAVDPPRLDPFSLLTGNATHSPAAAESQILVQYLASRAVVDEIGGALDLRRLFSLPQTLGRSWLITMVRAAYILNISRTPVRDYPPLT